MKIKDYALLTDENIDPEAVRRLLARGRDVTTAVGEGLGGEEDVEILRRAHQQRRVVVTHDADFGTLACYGGEPFIGIIYLRPGDVPFEALWLMFEELHRLDVDFEPPFIVVVEYRGGTVRIRLRPTIVK